MSFPINVREIVACNQSRRGLGDSATRPRYARGVAEAWIDEMIVLPHACAPNDMMLAAITQRPFCGEHYRNGAVGAAAYRCHDRGSELAHIRKPLENGPIGSDAPSRERSVLEQMPGALSVLSTCSACSRRVPECRHWGPWQAAI